MRALSLGAALACVLGAQTTWFPPAMLEGPALKAALDSVSGRETELIEEWVRLTETSSPTGKEKAGRGGCDPNWRS